MAKYLDISGLQRVWNRISSRVIRGDVAQSFTDAYKMQARANISAGASNRNLLDNPFFTVNQRNFTTSTGVNNIYSVDRWYIARGTGTISKTSNGITINGVGASRETTFQQMIDCGDLTGRTVALSVNDGGTIRQITGTVPARTTSNNIFIRFTLRDGVSAFLYAMATSSAYAYMLQFQVNAGYTIDLRAVKLELGSYSTLANDVPPDYGEELRKCQYYFERVKTAGTMVSLGIGYNDGYNTMYGVMKIEPKRVTPSLSGSSLLVGTTSLNTTSSSKSIYSFASDGTAVIQIVATNAFGTNQPYRFGLPANGYIDFSADL